MNQPKIVILEADQNRRDYIRSIVSDQGYVPYIFEKETICLDNLPPLNPDLVISGPLTSEKIFRFLHTVKMINRKLPILIITSERAVRESAISNGFGNVRVIRVNFDPSEINGAISNLLQKRIANSDNVDSESPMLIGNSTAIQKIKRIIFELRDSPDPILVQGEPGTGKELVARVLHFHSGDSKRIFAKVNLAGLDSSMLDKIFFERPPGIYANSVQNNHWTLSALTHAAYGTLFLDEIDTLPIAHQSRLLSIFEDNHYQTNKFDAPEKDNGRIKIVVASKKSLEQKVQLGKFRDDLFYRLNVIPILIPPLRDRVCDIPILMDFFADKFCLELGVGHIEVSKEFKEIFCSYSWPGNVRELDNMTRKVILQGGKDPVMVSLLQHWDRNKNLIDSYKELDGLAGANKLKNKLNKLENLSLRNVTGDFLARTEKKIIRKALDHTSWNRKKAAGLLDISYKSLLNKIKRYKLRR